MEESSFSGHHKQKGPVMGTAGLVGRQQAYLQAYMEKYGRRHSEQYEKSNDSDGKVALSQGTISRCARSETLAKYLRKRMENNSVNNDCDQEENEQRQRKLNERLSKAMIPGENPSTRSEPKPRKLITVTSSQNKTFQNYGEWQSLMPNDRVSCSKGNTKNLGSCTDPGMLSDCSDRSTSPALSTSSIDKSASPNQSRQTLGSNSSITNFFKKSTFRTRFHIPSLEDLKRKKKSIDHKTDGAANLNERRSFRPDSFQQQRHSSQKAPKTRSVVADGTAHDDLCFSNRGYGEKTAQNAVDVDVLDRRRHRSMYGHRNRTSTYDDVLSSTAHETSESECFRKTASFNTISVPRQAVDTDDAINRVQSDSSIMFSMTHTLPMNWTGEQNKCVLFYDSSDAESVCDSYEYFRLRNRSAHSLDEDHWSRSEETRLPNRLSLSFTERPRDSCSKVAWLPDTRTEAYVSALEQKLNDPSVELSNVTQNIYSHFPTGSDRRHGLQTVHQTLEIVEDIVSARERRRQLKYAAMASKSQPETLPRLERHKATETSPVSPSQLPISYPSCHSLPNSRPGSQPNSRPNSRSVSPQHTSVTDSINRHFLGERTSPSSRRRLYSAANSTGCSVSGVVGLTRAYSLPTWEGSPQTYLHHPYDDHYGTYRTETLLPSSNLLEVPCQQEYYTDPKCGSVVRSSSDVAGLHFLDNRKRCKRKPRPYKSDPFTEVDKNGRPLINYQSLKEKLQSQSVLPFASYESRSFDEPEENKEDMSASQEVLETDKKAARLNEMGGTQTVDGNIVRNRKHKASVCDDCEGVFTPARPLGDDVDYLCENCESKRTERKKAILEIVNTEISYGRDLSLIKEEFYLPMQNNSLLTNDQVSQIFLNLQELIDVNLRFSQSLHLAIERARKNDDEDFNSITIGKFFLENSFMFLAFENYCVKHEQASVLLERLEREKELLRIFLEVSQTENQLLRRMNLKSFLMIPVQRVFKYPLLLSRLYQATPSHHKDVQTIKEAQNRIEEILNHINASTKSFTGPSGPTRIKSKGTIVRKPLAEDIEIQKIAFSLLGKQHNEAVVAYMGKLQCALPTELLHWSRRNKGLKYTSVHGLILSTAHVLVPATYEDDEVIFPRKGDVTEASLVLLREKNSKYVPLRETMTLARCVISCEHDNDELVIEVQEMNKEALFLKTDSAVDTCNWLRTLRYQAKDVGSWRRRRNAFANIMISKPAVTGMS